MYTLKNLFTQEKKNPHRFVIRESFRLGVCEGGHLYNQSVKYTDIHTDRAQIKLIGNIGTLRSECSLNQGVQSQFWRINLAPPQFSHFISFTFYKIFW